MLIFVMTSISVTKITRAFVQWEGASLQPKSTTVDDAGFTMIAVITL